MIISNDKSPQLKLHEKTHVEDPFLDLLANRVTVTPLAALAQSGKALFPAETLSSGATICLTKSQYCCNL